MFDINKREYLKKYHKIESRFVIGTIGRFCYQKNPEFIIQIIKNMNEKKYDFTFIWIGDGPCLLYTSHFLRGFLKCLEKE